MCVVLQIAVMWEIRRNLANAFRLINRSAAVLLDSQTSTHGFRLCFSQKHYNLIKKWHGKSRITWSSRRSITGPNGKPGSMHQNGWIRRKSAQMECPTAQNVQNCLSWLLVVIRDEFMCIFLFYIVVFYYYFDNDVSFFCTLLSAIFRRVCDVRTPICKRTINIF